MQLIPKKFWKPPYRISIRAQLTALVSLVAIISLIILAVTAGVYFTANYKNLKTGRLYIAAQLKASQIDQTLNYLYYQCYYLSSGETLQNSLVSYSAGNISSTNWYESSLVLEKFLTSSDLFSVARLYDTNFNIMINATNNASGNYVPESVIDKLFTLSLNISLPSSLETIGICTDPVLNGSNFLMSMSLPIFANPSIILSDSRIYGYLSVIMSAEGLKSVFNDTTALENSEVFVISADYSITTNLEYFNFLFASAYDNADKDYDLHYRIDNDTFVYNGLVNGKGGAVKKTNGFLGTAAAVGYSSCSFSLVNWLAIVAQPEAAFSESATKLERIISGVVVAVAVFVCLLTFPLSHWAVQPLIRLQKATERIAEGRGLRPPQPTVGSSVSRNSSIKWRNSLENHVRSSLGFNANKLSDSGSITANNFKNNTSSSNSITSSHIYGNNNSSHSSMGINPDDDLSSSSQKYKTSANLIEARVPVYWRLLQDELSELTDTFNTMTDALDQHYCLLEERVRARTKQLEAAKIQAESANEAKTVFIANISHELRTPLNGILGMTAISMEEDDVDKIRGNLKLIFRSGELLLHILTELLTFSKNVLQRTKLEKRDFCITEVALQIKSIFGKLAKDQHVKLSIILMPNILRSYVLWGDSNRIIQVVMNLVSNALKFTPVDGNVDVRINLLGEYDEERSKAEDYKKVYVKQGTELPLNISHLKTEENNDISRKSETELNNDENETHTISKDDTADSSIKIGNEDVEISEVDKMGMASLVTTSSKSYDDTALMKQLIKSTDLDDDENKLGVELKEQKTWVISVEVKDTGSGIDPKLQESVFEPFVQGDQALSRQYGGTGLGLSICKQLSTMMNGTMELESEVGVGSKFIFTLPLKQTREISIPDDELFNDEFNAVSKKNRKVKFKFSGSSSAKSIKTRNSIGSSLNNRHSTTSIDSSSSDSDEEDNVRPSSVRLNRPFLQSTGTATSTQNVPTLNAHTDDKSKNKVLNKMDLIYILVAEDNHVNQEVIKRMLKLEGINNIDLARDGQDAFDKTKMLSENNGNYDIIFMDVQMPRLDGLAATKMIREELNYTQPIVALSAFPKEENVKECLDVGMNDFLSKPIKRPDLKIILKKYIEDFQ
ncbi:hypothetical protein TPHA_0D04590 [Tetrapisispora phaffii CBS 4417]|uniref:histidine kinase n=1 Tax=Tetrapisispora phaffii (strain ATCC 24235 / CBS 4417 / NBRC 1672 / NRRL Y-8282 / UCD 70-5) TaxID=1071381 RepID=G8BS19_TETPH|nr:hypothetical protein TPHA_0D04590 [Tetrapisispora phaffii CBS 4417]CCE63094.1 hypothetical protein TPHA_0D04590 [Tetrapisispora phaffii CBS 4417]